MIAWGAWPLARGVILVTALAFLVLWLQLTLYHGKAKFRVRAMWGPVIYAPVMVIVAAILSAVRGNTVETIYLVVFALGIAEGLIGSYLHLRGVLRLPGGLTWRNLAVGPPLALATLFCLLSLLGVLAAVWAWL